MKIESCRGDDKKISLLDSFSLECLAHYKLLHEQEKWGCCGILRDQYYIFRFVEKKSKEETYALPHS